MTTPNEPTFSYPANDAREFWAKCSKDDPDASEYWCPCKMGFDCAPDWQPARSFNNREPHNDPTCGTIWRKKVQVPDGWEIVPLDYLWDGRSEMKGYVASDSQFIKSTWGNSVFIKDAIEFARSNGRCAVEVYIQPIYEGAIMAPTPPAPHESDLILAMLITGGFVSKEKVEQARAFVARNL